VVVGWLAWVRRRRLRDCRPVGSYVGPMLVLAGWLLYSLGDTHLVQTFWHGGAILLAVGCLTTVAGRDVLVKFLPAFLALGFLVPVPGMVRQQIAIPLQTVTAEVTQRVFEILGVAVERSGNMLSINGVDVQIAEACNGLRMVFALVLVSFAFAFGNPLRPYARILVLAAAPLSAILCNVVRLVPTVWLFGNQSRGFAEGFHDLSAWVMLLISFLILMGIIRLLRWALVPITRYTLAYD
jgi:exosortase